MRRHWAGMVAAAVPVLLLVPLTTTSPSQAASRPVLPSQDPFYTYSGSQPLSSIPAGTVLKARSVPLALGTLISTPIRAEQLLYRTTGQLGQPVVTATTVLEPTPVPVLARIVDYLSFYDGLGSQCDPSFTLAGGDPGGSTNEQEADEEELLVAWYLSQGDIVTIPDFEGSTGLDWMAGRQSGYGALDAVRATESYLGLTATATEVGLSGYSGGAVAADWSAELAPSYAPALNLVGVAMGGIPVNYIDMFNYISGSPEYSVAIVGMLIGLTRAYGIPLDPYLTSSAVTVEGQIGDTCMASNFGNYTLSLPQVLTDPNALTDGSAIESILAQQTMGSISSQSVHPTEPLLMGVGNSDGTGDGAMVAADVAGLARQYCQEGVPVDFQEYTGASHEEAGAFFEPQTGPFLQARFAGVPWVDNCSSLG